MTGGVDTQVLIVGAGPTGLTLAGELARRGVDSTLIDSLDAPLHWDRATIVHPRTMELFATLGIADRMHQAGVEQRYIYIYSDGELLAEMDLAESGSPFGFNLNASEEVTESVLTEHLHEHGGSVEHGRKLTGLKQLPDRVIATIGHEGEEYEMSADWIVGCGGLHSPVRDLSGIEFEGHDIAEPWAVLDATLTGWPHGHDANFAFLDRDSVILTPLPDQRWRAYIRPTGPDSDLVEDATRIVGKYAPGTTIDEVENPTRFHCHTNVAAHYRKGRALLAGDAAHVCSPSQGHGMNTGIQDAFNLAWKLAMVCRGEADQHLLDSYEEERRPVAFGVTTSGDDFETMQTLIEDDQRGERDRSIRATFADQESRRVEILAETELNITYLGSAIVAGARGNPAPGERLPNEDAGTADGAGRPGLHDLTVNGTGHTLLVIGRGSDWLSEALQEIDPEIIGAFDGMVAIGTEEHPSLSGLIEPEAADRLGVDEVAILAIRPDGHVGFRVDAIDAGPVRDYLDLIRAGGTRPGSANAK